VKNDDCQLLKGRPSKAGRYLMMNTKKGADPFFRYSVIPAKAGISPGKKGR
jgi:hypothetical protein